MPAPLIAPILNDLVISYYDSISVSFAQPTFSNSPNPGPTLNAYIGYYGTISVSGSTVSNYLQTLNLGSGGGFSFSGLSLAPMGQSLIVVVTAVNSQGYDVAAYEILKKIKMIPELALP